MQKNTRKNSLIFNQKTFSILLKLLIAFFTTFLSISEKKITEYQKKIFFDLGSIESNIDNINDYLLYNCKITKK